jgi:NADPH-dependent 2,4-dienoyl-CoA reductase/sulfur reductase-like enzyme
VADKIGESRLFVRPLAEYKEQDIKLRLGQEVVDVNFDKRELTLQHKEVVCFDGLVIATGGRPRTPETLQSFGDLLLTLKTIADAKIWKERLPGVNTVLLIGGDLTSSAFAKALLHLGKKVDFILDEDCFWPVKSYPEAREEVAERLRKAGISVLSCKKIEGLTRTPAGECRVETDGGTFHAGLVGAFFGLIPDVRFLAGTGLHIERGILVDEYLRTPFDGVFAAGDCAQVYHPKLRDYWVSIGYVNAEMLGSVAGMNLAGCSVRAEPSSTSIFELEGHKLNTSWWSEI